MPYLALFLAGFVGSYPLTSFISRFTKKYNFRIHFRGFHFHHSRLGLILMTAELGLFIGQVFAGVIYIPLAIYPGCFGGFLAMLIHHIRSEGFI